MSANLTAAAADRLGVAQSANEPFGPVRELLKPYGRDPGANVLSRWIHKGVRGAKLRVIRMGNRLLSKPSWVLEFVQAQNPDVDLAAVPAPKPATPKQRADRLARARAELDAD